MGDPDLLIIEPTSMMKRSRMWMIAIRTIPVSSTSFIIRPVTGSRSLAGCSSERFGLFGDYEDAIVKGENSLWHGVLTPMLNIGLLTPDQVVKAALKHGQAPSPIEFIGGIPAADHRLARIHESHVCRS